ncbi:ATP-binding protein [Sphaerimonospora cavernae]|uniref:ATP-binding protein n=1 Tax=Sphaerimonospora cavernae TaxID=1740611 RepID=A0ABV6TX38_9ACTN
MRDDGAPAHVTGSARERGFSLADLPDVREFAADEARRGGMPDDAVGDFLLAVNEVATNAVTHGSTKARLSVWRDGEDLVVGVHDEGRDWRPEGAPGETPPPENATSGMGLWVARRLSRDIAVETGSGGTTVTMRFPVRAG